MEQQKLRIQTKNEASNNKGNHSWKSSAILNNNLNIISSSKGSEENVYSRYSAPFMPVPSVSAPLSSVSEPQAVPYIFPQINNFDGGYLGSVSNPSFPNSNIFGCSSNFNPYLSNYYMPSFNNTLSQFSGMSTPAMLNISKFDSNDINSVKPAAVPLSMANSDPIDKLTSKVRRLNFFE